MSKDIKQKADTVPLSPNQQREYERMVNDFCRCAQCFEPSDDMKQKAILHALTMPN